MGEIKLSISRKGSEHRCSAPKEDKGKREKGKLGGRNKGRKERRFWCYDGYVSSKALKTRHQPPPTFVSSKTETGH
ncbi:unnamed protein product [Sphenostylis stenocarpa]|uniref:Uncharacterized protein n=1 Tax=Sphenostylis stenocarpa TaxID=92480 RepID=A0AA86RZ98_9FABA|nr:unnamed protein product [Sphenostylis stenocarpa]